MAMAFLPLSPSEPPRVFGAPTLSTESELLALGMAIDGSLWSIEEPGLMRQWNLANRKQRGQHSLDELATVWAFNWAGRLAGSASDEVAVWEVYSGEQLAAWPAPAGRWVTAMAFQPGAAVVATGHDEDGLVQVWEWQERRLIREFTDHARGVSALAFSLDRRHLAVASEDRLIAVYDLETGAKVRTLRDHTDRIPALAWHPDGNRLFSAGWDTTVRVWDLAAGSPIILLNNHKGQVHAIALSADGRLLAAADSANAVHVWDTDRYEEVATLRDSSSEVRCLCFTPDDDRGNRRPPLLAYGGADRVIYLWDSRQGADGAGDPDAALARAAVTLDPTGAILYSVGPGTALRGFAVGTGEDVLSPDGAPALRAFAQSPDGRWLAASRLDPGQDGLALMLLDAAGKPVTTCQGQKGPITALAFNHRSDLLASGGARSYDVWLWQVPAGEPALLIPDAVDDCAVEALAWRPGTDVVAVAGIDFLATGGRDGEVVLWDVSRRSRLFSLPGGATAITFSPDGKLLAAAHLRRTVVLYDADTGAVVRTMNGHQDVVTCLAFSPDGKWLASGGDDRTLRLWEVANAEPAAAWELDDQVRAVAFGPEGRFVYTGNGNTSCYQIELERLLASATL